MCIHEWDPLSEQCYSQTRLRGAWRWGASSRHHGKDRHTSVHDVGYDSLKCKHVMCRPVGALGFHPCITAVTQLAGMYGLGILVVLSAYAGYTVTASILEVAADTLILHCRLAALQTGPQRSTQVRGFAACACAVFCRMRGLALRCSDACVQGLGLCTGMLAWIPGYAAAGIIALMSPLFLAILPILAPVSIFVSACTSASPPMPSPCTVLPIAAAPSSHVQR